MLQLQPNQLMPEAIRVLAPDGGRDPRDSRNHVATVLAESKLVMDTKACTKCKQVKPLTEFPRRYTSPGRYQSWCKACMRPLAAASAKRHRDARRIYRRKWREQNHDKLAASVSAYNRQYRGQHREKARESSRQYWLKTRDRLLREKAANTSWYQQRLTTICEYNKRWYHRHLEKARASGRKMQARMRQTKPWLQAWRHTLRGTLDRLGTPKEATTLSLLGYTANELKVHLEALFQPGMSWENYGQWHIDHVRPVKSFVGDTRPSVVNALSNLQPLWARDNFHKGAKYECVA